MNKPGPQLDDMDAQRRRRAVLQWGWGLFTSCAIGCALTSYWLYSWVVDVGAGAVRFWVEGLFCAPFCLLSCVGFIQIMGGVTCDRLSDAWTSFTRWRRILIVLSVMAAILFLVSFSYLLAILAQPTFPRPAGASDNGDDLNLFCL